jgi:hypothetical protein
MGVGLIMKMLAICSQCLVNNGKSLYNEVEIDEKGIFEFTCAEGHKNLNILQLHSFQILFDLGIKALMDGYTREGVSSIAVAVERFHEYCIEIFLKKLPNEEYEKTWKLVSAQSERQLGAFYFLYLEKFNKAPVNILSKWIKFRNDVTHKGVIPKQEKAIEYAEYIYNYIKKIIIELKTLYNDNLDVLLSFLSRKLEKRDAHVGHINWPTFIELAQPIDYLENESFESKWKLHKSIVENQNKLGIKRYF